MNSIIWPNPEFDNNITVYGPEVKALVERYLVQMIGELRELPHPEGGPGSLLDAIDLVVPHQANKTMVTELAGEAGLTPDRLYFNIERVGNVSAASIPIAIHALAAGAMAPPPRGVVAPVWGGRRGGLRGAAGGRGPPPRRGGRGGGGRGGGGRAPAGRGGAPGGGRGGGLGDGGGPPPPPGGPPPPPRGGGGAGARGGGDARA